MKTFKDYLAEKLIANATQPHELMNNAMHHIDPAKRDSARSYYKKARSKGFSHASAVTSMLNLHREETDLLEISKTKVKKALFAALAREKDSKAKGDMVTAVKTGKRITSVMSRLKEEVLTEDDKFSIIEQFVEFAADYLQLENIPQIEISEDTAKAKEMKTYGFYNPMENTIWVYAKNRNTGDILRTLAHEMTHSRQNELGQLYEGAGKAGTDIENHANASAAVMLRHFGTVNTAIYECVNP